MATNKTRIPWPPARLTSNKLHGRQWYATHDIKTKYKLDAKVCFQNDAITPPDGWTGGIRIAFHQPSNHGRDVDNLLRAIKGALDQLSKFIGVDDKNFWFDKVTKTYDPNRIGFVEIELVLGD